MNRRRHPRLVVNHPAVIHHGEKSYSGYQILNFSTGGLYLQAGDSGLLEQLGYGFHGHPGRPLISVELSGFRRNAKVEVAYVHQTGLGVAFVHPEPELCDYLQKNRRAASTTHEAPAPEAQGIGSTTRAILEHLRGKTLEYLKTHFERFLVLSDQELIAASDDNRKANEQADLFLAVNTLEKQGGPIKRDFFTRLEASFNALLEDKAEIGVKQQRLDQELSLVDKQDFDEWLLLNGIAHRVDAQLANQSQRLDLVLSRMLQRPIKSESNPLSSISLLSCLRESLAVHDFAQEAKPILYAAFGKVVFGNIHRLYGEIHAFLQQEGLETDAPGKDSRPVIAPASSTADQPQQPSQALEQPSSQVNLAGAMPLKSATSAQHPVAPHGRVIDSIDAMPLRHGWSLLKQLEGFLQEGLDESLSLDSSTRAKIGAGAELVVAVKQDDIFSSPVRELIERLEVPFIKEAINDPAMLETADHPGRRFFQALEGLAPYCNGGDQAGRRGIDISRGLEHMFREIDQGSLTNIDQVTHQLEELQDQQKALFERNRKLAIESFKRNEKLRQAYQQVKSSLQTMLLGKSVSVVLDKLFQYGWANLLIHTAMLQKRDSPEWKAYLRVIEILNRLLCPGKPSTLLSTKHKTDLLKIIRKGFADYPVHPEGTERFVQELQHALEDPVAAQTYIDSRIEIDQNYLTRLFVGQVSIDLAESAAPQVEDRWRAQVADTEVGAWLLQHRQDSQDRMLNLASKDPESKRYLLVDNSGIKVMETDLNYLAQQFAANTLAALDDRKLPVVDRAVQRILSKTYDSIDQQISCDELTGLVNRRAFERMLNDLLHAGLTASSHVLIMLDVDQFGLVNDLCGFEGGDRLLQSITNLLHNYLPLNGQLARTGDDEFAILVNECSLDQGFQIAETQRQSIDAYRYSWANQLIPVSASVGVVGFSGSERTSGDLLKAASSACNIAKQAGRNCTRVYREDDQAFMEHKQLIKSVASIEDALARDRFVLVAQCIEPLQKGTAKSHYEILLRVLDENDALQGPFHFINAAEKYDLMRSVDRWVVRRFFAMANAQAAGLGEIGGFSINLSGQSIADDEFKQFLIKQIEASPLPRDRLGFEITETVMVKDPRDAVRFIEAIRAMGCSFYLDDFGSGYASFSSLKELPVDYVKIDGIFIKDLLQDRASQTMVKSVTEIAHFMGRQVIAEFVENQQTADALRVIGVDFIQGYHIGRPVPLHEILRTDTLCSNYS